jgi:microcystin-dependent protein
MTTGAVTIAVDGTVTKSGIAGTIYDAAVTVLAAKVPAVTIPTGPNGVPIKTGIADVCNTVAPGVSAVVVPLGSTVGWPLNTNPSDTDWLICDGKAISRTTYATLFALVGTTWGSGDGSTTFNLPDFRGRVALGGNNASLPNAKNATYATRNLAATGGEETHVLTTSELPSHTHTLTDPGHAHGSNSGAFVTSTAGADAAGAGTTFRSENNTASNTTGITIANTGSDAAHENLPPFLVMNTIMKVL